MTNEQQEHLEALVRKACKTMEAIKFEQRCIRDLRYAAKTDLHLDPKDFNCLVSLSIAGDTSWLT